MPTILHYHCCAIAIEINRAARARYPKLNLKNARLYAAAISNKRLLERRSSTVLWRCSAGCKKKQDHWTCSRKLWIWIFSLWSHVSNSWTYYRGDNGSPIRVTPGHWTRKCQKKWSKTRCWMMVGGFWGAADVRSYQSTHFVLVSLDRKCSYLIVVLGL